GNPGTLASCLIHEFTLDGVLFTRSQTLILHSVNNSATIMIDEFVTVSLVDSRCSQSWFVIDDNSLLFIFNVFVHYDWISIWIFFELCSNVQTFKDHQSLASEFFTEGE